MAKSLMEKLGLKHSQTPLVQKLREWVTRAALSEKHALYGDLSTAAGSFTAWVVQEDPKKVDAFAQGLGSFTASMGIDLHWLLNEQVVIAPELKESLEDVVALYCLSYWKALQVQNDVRAFAIYQSWQMSPAKGRNPELSQKLFAALMDRGLIEDPPSSLFMASEQEREAYVVGAIRKVAQNNQPEFNAVLKEVLGLTEVEAEDAPIVTPPPVEEPPAPPVNDVIRGDPHDPEA
ncbi:MAG: hypothetical protein JW981_09165 [Anaerolineae bacterium]|nr:hypothetical protein [Anaerolineae bacterium]